MKEIKYKVMVQLKETNTPIVHDNVRSTYTKGYMYCVMLENLDVEEFYKEEEDDFSDWPEWKKKLIDDYNTSADKNAALNLEDERLKRTRQQVKNNLIKNGLIKQEK